MELIRTVGTSTAIFAPAWSLETFGLNFIDKDLQLWYGDGKDHIATEGKKGLLIRNASLTDI